MWSVSLHRDFPWRVYVKFPVALISSLFHYFIETPPRKLFSGRWMEIHCDTCWSIALLQQNKVCVFDRQWRQNIPQTRFGQCKENFGKGLMIIARFSCNGILKNKKNEKKVKNKLNVVWRGSFTSDIYGRCSVSLLQWIFKKLNFKSKLNKPCLKKYHSISWKNGDSYTYCIYAFLTYSCEIL